VIGRVTARGLAAASSVPPGSTAVDVTTPNELTALTPADPAPGEGEPPLHCSTLTAPLDPAGSAGGGLDLAVAAAGRVDAPRDVHVVGFRQH
jgi:hypothetical protein